MATTYSISPGTVTVNENAGTVTFTVNRSGTLSAETVFGSTTPNHGSTNNGDYTGLNSQGVAFSSGQTSQTVTVSITNDTIVESDETFGFIVQRNASDPVTTFLASSTFTIHDDDVAPTTYSISPGTVTVNENAGTVTFTINRSGGLPAETVFASTTTNHGSTNNGDYTGLNSQGVAFSSGQTSQTVTVSITNDTIVESDETFGFIVQRNASDPVTTFLASSTFTIHDDDVAPTTYSISPGTVTVNENAGTVTFTINRSGGLPAETVFASTTTNHGSANNGDYTGISSQGVAFSSGQTSQTVTVSITNDTIVESDETFGFIVQRNASDPVTTFLASSTFTIHDDDVAPTTYSISPGTVTVNENAGTVTFTVNRSGGLPAETVFASTTTNQGSANNGDYTGISSQGVAFSSGQTSQTVTLSITNDTIVESDETFGFIVQRNASDPVTTYLASSTFTIHDDDVAPTTYSISPGTVTVNENAGTVTFTINRSGGLPAETVFASTTTNHGSTNNGDYTGLNSQGVAFSSGQTSQTVTVSITNDTIVESDETFGFIVQRNASDPVTTFLASSTFTIHDDDPPAITTYSISPGTVTVNENAGTVTFTINRSGGLPAETVFASTTTNQGSANNGDYTGISSQGVAFSSGQTSQTVTVSITNDTIVESDETFGFIVQRNASDPVSTFLASSTFTIHDDDPPAITTYSISPGTVTVNENAGTVTFTINRSGGLPAETVFASTTTNHGSANNGDYTGISSQGVAFSSGQTSQTVTVSITNDTIVESDETFGFIVQRNASDPVTTFLASSTFTIHDDDPPAITTYSISPGTVTVNENAGTVTFTINRSGGLPAETVFASTTTNHGSTNNGDYTGLNSQGVAFSSGQTSQTVTVSITNDTIVESDETFGFIVQRNASDPVTTFLASSTFTIHDDDPPATTTYSISPGTVTVNENAGTVTFTINRSGGLPAETVFASTTTNQGSANNGDYTGISSQGVAFSSGQTSQTVTVSITNDTIVESDETFGFIVQRNASDPVTTFLASSTFTIHDDDPPATTTYSISPGTVTVNENAGTVTFTITRQSIGTAATVYVSTTQTEGSTNSGDYTPLAGQAVAFGPKELSKTVTVSITNDNVAESNETFGLIVQSNPTDPVTTFLASSTFTIHDDDPPATTTYSISPGTVTVNENAGTVTFTINRSGGLPAETVFASTTTNHGSTNNGDYTGLNSQGVAFSSGQTSQTVTVSITNDTIVESDETFGFIVQRNASDPVTTFLASSTFTIHDDDPPATTTYSISPGTVTVNENAGTVTFTITRQSIGTAATVYVSTTQTEGSTNSGDYTPLAGQAVAFGPKELSKTVTVSITNDNVAESNETFGLIVQSNPTDPVTTFLASSTFTIHDDDPPATTTYSISPGTVTVNENAGTVTFTINRSGGLPAETVFASTTTNHGSTNNGDYTGLNSQGVAFSSGQTSQTVTVSITNDTIVESDETFGFIVQRNASDPVTTFLASSTFTIHDDDPPATTTYSISPGTVTVNENAGTVTFTITRQSIGTAATVYVSTTQTEGSTNSGDYTPLAGQAVAFGPKELSKTVTVSITNDNVAESNETFGLIVQSNPTDPVTTFLASSTFTIHDDDPPATTTYSISPGTVTVNENAGTVTFTINRSGGLPAETVFASTTTNQGSANNGDYTGISSQGVAFSSGQTSQTVTVSITNDTIVESDETFGFIVQRNASDPVTTFLASSTFTIHDDDPPAITTYSISPGTVTVNENAGTVTFTINRSGGLPAETVFASTTTNQGSANNGDYTGISSQGVAFSSGQTSQTVTLSITNDTIVESDETFGFIVQRNASDPVTTYLASSTFTIHDDDVATLTGQAILNEALTHLGEEYYWSQRPNGTPVIADYDNVNYGPGPSGGWDCAEFVSYCVYQVYLNLELGLRDGANGDVNTPGNEASSNYWIWDAGISTLTHQITLPEARNTPGAILITRGVGSEPGHVAISMGDGTVINATAPMSDGQYHSDDGTGYPPQAKLPPVGVDIGDVKISTFGWNSSAYIAVLINGVTYSGVTYSTSTQPDLVANTLSVSSSSDLRVSGIVLSSPSSIVDLAGNSANLSGAGADTKLGINMPPGNPAGPSGGNFTITGTTELELFGASTESVSFASGAKGELKLDASSQFTGQVSGFTGQDLLDLTDIAFGPNTTLGYTVTSNNTGGTLTVSDGAHTANIALLGQYTAASFVPSADGFGGTLIHDAPPATLTQTLTQPQHA